MKKSTGRTVALTGIFLAVMLVVQLLSQIVYTFWPLPIQPAFMQIVVIIGSIVLGPKIGAFLGFFMGMYSFVYSTLFPIPTSFLFTPFQPHGNIWSLVIAFVPRILVGILPYFVYQAMKNRFGAGLSGFVGAITNTILVLGGIFLFFGGLIHQSFGAFVASIVTGNSLIEAVAAIILTAAIVPALEKRNR